MGPGFPLHAHRSFLEPSSAPPSSMQIITYAINAFEGGSGVRTVPGTAKLFGTYAVCSESMA